ncbi:response regulator [Thalassobacterium maritimum]|nr:response regulator transcription factor [Coraliomargarita sp. SDUM461003]
MATSYPLYARMKTVYIIEDEEILRDLLSTFIATTYPDLELLGMTGDGGEGIEKCIELAPDLVIVDIQLPEVNGLEILHRLKSNFPKIKILIFSGKTTYQSVKIAVNGKADGFINKISGIEELEQAINAVSKGEEFFSPDIRDEVARIRAEPPGRSRPPFAR